MECGIKHDNISLLTLFVDCIYNWLDNSYTVFAGKWRAWETNLPQYTCTVIIVLAGCLDKAEAIDVTHVALAIGSQQVKATHILLQTTAHRSYSNTVLLMSTSRWHCVRVGAEGVCVCVKRVKSAYTVGNSECLPNLVVNVHVWMTSGHVQGLLILVLPRQWSAKKKKGFWFYWVFEHRFWLYHAFIFQFSYSNMDQYAA